MRNLAGVIDSPRRKWLLPLLDAALLLAAAAAAYGLRRTASIPSHGVYTLGLYVPFIGMLVACWLLMMYAFGMYGRNVDQPARFWRALIRINYNFILLVSVSAFALRVTATNRTLCILFVVLSNAVVTATHGIFVWRRSKTFTIVGTDVFARNTLDATMEYFALRDAHFAGFVSPATAYNTFFQENGLPMFGSLENVLARLSKQVDCVVVALPSDFPGKQRLVDDLEATGLKILFAQHIPERVELASA